MDALNHTQDASMEVEIADERGNPGERTLAPACASLMLQNPVFLWR